MCYDTAQAWLQGNSTPTQPGGGERNGAVTLQRTPDWSSLLSSQVASSPFSCVGVYLSYSPLVNTPTLVKTDWLLWQWQNILFSFFPELDISLKKDPVLSADGSSLEALLKSDSFEKRPAADPRGSEEDSNQSDYAGGLSSATRVRKVHVVSIRRWRKGIDPQGICLIVSLWLCVVPEDPRAGRLPRWPGWWRLRGRYT